jgi:diketogulonate reductase-like aldo/keto reductase
MGHASQDTLRVAKEHGVMYQSYATLRGGFSGPETLTLHAQAEAASPHAAALRLMVDNGIAVIPRSSSAERVRANMQDTLAVVWKNGVPDIASLYVPKGEL